MQDLRGALLLRMNYQLQEECFAEDDRTELVWASQRSAPLPLRILQVMCSKDSANYVIL